MTPYEINILLWYHTRPGDHQDVCRNPPIWRPTITMFLEQGLLRLATERRVDDPCYEIGERGRAYCEALQRVPLPESRWIIVWPTEHGRG